MNSTLASQLVFGSQTISVTDEELAKFLDSDPKYPRPVDSSIPRLRSRNYEPSPYISVFEDIVQQVLAFEDSLLTKVEFDAIKAFSRLEYVTRYILIRLGLRKSGSWHTGKSLEKYISEVGPEGLRKAIEQLCISVKDILEDETEVKMEEEVIDLTVDLDGEDSPKPSTSHNTSPRKRNSSAPPSAQLEVAESSTQSLAFFCNSQMSLDDTLERLSVSDLKDIAKDCKVKVKLPNKEAFIKALKQHARSQQNLFAFMKASSSVSQEGRLQRMAAKKLGPCLRVTGDFHKLLRKIHIIFYRSTVIPQTLFLDSYLTFFKKRDYPPYAWSRSTIWSSLDEYLFYEKALDLQALVESVMDESFGQPREVTPKKNPALKTRFVTPVESTPTPVGVSGGAETTPIKREENVVKMEVDEDNCVDRELGFEEVDLSFIFDEGFRCEDDDGDDKKRAGPETILRAARIVKIYEVVIKPMWDWCIARAKVKREKDRDPSLERFEQGYVLARLLGKAAQAYALLHKYEKELEVLQILLDQRYWRRAKRGKWYERRALVKDTHLPRVLKARAKQYDWTKGQLQERLQGLLEETRESLYEALEDEDTHRVYRKSLVNRLTKIEKRLNIPFQKHHSYSEILQPAKYVAVFAYRAERSFGKFDGGQKWKGKESEDIAGYFIRGGLPVADESEDANLNILPRFPSSIKSVWKTSDESGTCSVEERALEHYAEEGYKGFHSETSILTTIYGLLFWDILFAEIPGAFETKFQIAPLDLTEDSFYHARIELIKRRLEELKDGKALEILDRHDSRYRANKTWCVGVNWNLCEKDELAQIVECIGGETLAIICDLFSHDYAARASGVPDLIVWNHEDRKCKFVEVKGPGDRARDNQTLWFDTLLSAGLDVDLCKVMEDNTKNRNAERERLDKLRAKAAKKEEDLIKKEEKAKSKKGSAQKKRKAVKGEVKTEDQLDMNIGGDDDDYVDRWDVEKHESELPFSPSRPKRRRREDDDLDPDTRIVLALLQGKVMSQDADWPPDPTVDASPLKKRKID